MTYEHRCGPNMALADATVLHVPRDTLCKVFQPGKFTMEEVDAVEDHFDETRSTNWPNLAALAMWLLSVGTLLTLAVRSRKQADPPPTPAG